MTFFCHYVKSITQFVFLLDILIISTKVILLEHVFQFPLILWSFYWFQNSCWLCIHFLNQSWMTIVGKNIWNAKTTGWTPFSCLLRKLMHQTLFTNSKNVNMYVESGFWLNLEGKNTLIFFGWNLKFSITVLWRYFLTTFYSIWLSLVQSWKLGQRQI